MRFKGQAAIEYLMTYGWMLAAVAMVSGIIYSSTGASFCSNSISGYSIHSAQVNDFGLTAGEPVMQLDVQNNDPQGFTHNLTSVTVQDRDMEELKRTVSLDQRLGPGSSQVVEVSGIENSNTCNTFDVTIVYDRGSVLPNQKASGTITATAEIVESTNVATTFETEITSVNPASPGENTTINYQVENTGQEGTQTVEFNIDGTTVQTNSITLGSYESVSRTYKHVFTSTGDHSISLASDNTTDSGTINIPEPDTEFTLQNMNAPNEAAVGGTMDVSAEIVSEKGSTTSDAELIINGTKLDTQTVSVSNGETQTVNFNEVSLDGISAGEHNIELLFEGETISDTVTLIGEPQLEKFTISDESVCEGNGNSCNQNDYASYHVNWSASDPNNNLNEANVTFNGNLPGGNWESINGSRTFEDAGGTYENNYNIRFQASYSNGDYICAEYTDTADGTGPSGSYTGCS